MKFALVFLLLAVIIIPSADCWRRRRRRRWFRAPRLRVPRIRVRKIFKKVIKVIKKVKPIVKQIVKPIVKQIVKPIEKQIVKPIEKVVKPVLKALVKPILKPLQNKVCGSPPEEQSERQVEDEYEGRDVDEELEDHLVVRSEGEIEDQLEMFARQGRALEGLNEIVRDERDVREIHKILQNPMRSKRLLTKLVGALCGGGGGGVDEGEEQGCQGQDQEVEQIVEVPHTVIEYVTAPTA